jgi:ATP-binding cassette, subfamily B, multidrug efflux pump
VERLKRFWFDYAHRYRWVYLAGVVCLVFTNVLTVAIPKLVQHAIDGLDPLDSGEARGWVSAIILAGVAIMLVRTLSRTLFFNPGRTVEFRLKNNLFQHLMELPQGYYDRVRPGEIISRGTNDANSVRALIGFGSLQLFNVVFVLILTMIQMLTTHWQLTLICCIPLLFAAVILRYAIKGLFKLSKRAQAQIAVLSDRILEFYNGVNVIRSYNAFEGARHRFDDANSELLEIGLGLVRITSWLLPVVFVVGNVCLVMLLFFGGPMVIEGDLTIGELAAFAVYINILVVALTSLGWLINSVQRGWISLGRVSEVLEEPLERPVGGDSVPEAVDGGLSLKIDDLNFAYDSEAQAVVEGVSVQANPGQTVGVFGPTGSGKTTLLNLIARVYEPPDGTVRIGGVDVLSLDVKEYWNRVAIVSQEAFLFSTSISNNIALAEGANEDNAERIRVAAEDAQLTEDLKALPEGLDTRVGERGITLSGGQRQRTALARAFYRDFDLLLLDDVLSAVDHATEEKLIRCIYQRAKGATMVLVSHRTSVLQQADMILVMEEGRVVARGTHAELIEQEGVYRQAWRLQLDQEEEGAGD